MDSGYGSKKKPQNKVPWLSVKGPKMDSTFQNTGKKASEIIPYKIVFRVLNNKLGSLLHLTFTSIKAS